MKLNCLKHSLASSDALESPSTCRNGLTQIVEHLKRHVDSLGPNVHSIEVSHDGELVEVTSKPNEDKTRYLFYPVLPDLQKSTGNLINKKNLGIRKPRTQKGPRMRTVHRAGLHELDRLAPEIDLVSYRGQKLAFKHTSWNMRLKFLWRELNITARLPPHPNIVPFHRVVVEKLQGEEGERIVGFTTSYITGGSLDTKGRFLFKLKWLKQLISVIDDLNYKYGIQHQDVAPRNLLVHEATDNIMLIDFDVSARYNSPGDPQPQAENFEEDRNDVKGVIFTLYEIITRDEHFRDVEHRLQDASSVQDIEWVKHPDVRLNKPLEAYRKVLDEWVEKRKERANEGSTDRSSYIDWPGLPGVPNAFIEGREARAKKIQVVEWKRPAQGKIKEGMSVFADGTVARTAGELRRRGRRL